MSITTKIMTDRVKPPPYSWKEPERRLIKVNLSDNTIYGEIIFTSGLVQIRYDGEVYSCFDNGELKATSKDVEDMKRYL